MITFKEYVQKKEFEEGIGDWWNATKTQALPYALAGASLFGGQQVANAAPPPPQSVRQQYYNNAKVLSVKEVGNKLEVVVQMPYSQLYDKMGIDNKSFHVNIAVKKAKEAAVKFYGVDENGKPLASDLNMLGADKPEKVNKTYTQKFYFGE